MAVEIFVAGIVFGVFFCILGMLSWFFGYVAREPKFLGRLQIALNGNFWFLIGLYFISSVSGFFTEATSRNWLLYGGGVSILISVGISYLVPSEKDSVASTAVPVEIDTMPEPAIVRSIKQDGEQVTLHVERSN